MARGLCPSLVGRDGELAQLAGALELALGGSGGLVVVSGEAGIGKSRLARELADQARAGEVRVLTGRAAHAGTPVPYRPLVEALHSGLVEIDDLEAPALDPYRGALRRLLPGVGLGALPREELSPLGLMEGVLRLLVVIAQHSGLLLVLEDLHWADADSLGLIEYLADHLPATRVLCVCTERSDSSADASDLIATLAARRTAERIVLSPLPPEQVEAMVRLTLATDEVPPVLTRTLHERAAGVPFLVEETLSAYLAAGGPAQRSPEWWISRRIADALPPSYRGMVAQRLASLDDDARNVVTSAAVVGRSFDPRLIAAMTALHQRDVMESLRSAVAAGLIWARAAPSAVAFEFRHALAREAVLTDLLPPERADLSRRAALAIEATFPGLPGDWCQRAADLFEQGGEPLRACGLLQEAARRAILSSAFATAELILARARELAGDDWMAWMGVEDLLLDVYSLAGKTEQVLELGTRLVDVLEQRYLGYVPAQRLAGLHLKTARGVAPAGDWDVARSQLAAARDLAERSGDDALLAQIDALDARVSLSAGQLSRARSLAGKTEQAAERLGLTDALCEALYTQGLAAAREGAGETAASALTRCAQVADRHGLPLWRVRALLELGTVDHVARGELDRLLEGGALARTIGAVSALAAIDLQLAWAHLGRAELDAADRAIERCLEICRPHRLASLPSALTAQCMLHALRGERDGFEAIAAEALGDRRDSLVEAAIEGNGRAVLSLVNGDEAGALEHLDAAVRLGGDAGDWTISWLAGPRALLCAVRDRGTDVVDSDGSGAPASTLTAAYLSYARAVTAGRDGRQDEARDAMTEADAAMPPGWRRAHARLLVARCAFADGWGDPTAWMRESLTFLESASLSQFAAACKSLLRKSGAPVPRRGRGESTVPAELQEHGVTSREMDVLHLVAERLSNREIGERLFLSPRTVESHITSLLRRLSLDSRGELARLGRRYEAGSGPSDRPGA